MRLKREKEINTFEYTNNISIPEARKIVQNSNKFPTKLYSEATKQNIENKHNHTSMACHSIFEKLASLTPDTLPKYIVNLKSSLSESTKQSTSTSSPSFTKPLQQNENSVQRGNTTHVTPQITPNRSTSPVRQETRSPSRGIRQSPTPRHRIQLEKTNSKIDFLCCWMRSPWSSGHHHLPLISHA